MEIKIMDIIERILFLLLMLTVKMGAAQVITMEAQSQDPTLVVRGVEIKIDTINPEDGKNIKQGVVLFTSDFLREQKITLTKQFETALVCNEQMVVTRIITQKVSTSKINFNTGGFVVVGTSNSKEFFERNFKQGHVVKLRIDDKISSLADIKNLYGNNVRLQLDGNDFFTTQQLNYSTTGKIINPKKNVRYVLEVTSPNHSKTVRQNIVKSNTFTIDYPLKKGVNYIDITLLDGGNLITQKSVVVFSKFVSQKQSDVVMWVEQFPNAKTLTDVNNITEMVLNCKKAGVTALGFDVKGPEGFVSYKKNNLSHTPYFTAIQHPKKAMPESDFDLLETMIRVAHQHGIRVYVSLNFFTEGNITLNEYAVLKQHPEWEEIVQRPEDKGKLLPISQSFAGKEAQQGKRVALSFVNPVHKEVQDYQILRVKEILENYDVDAIVFDRTRYDNLYADFSTTSRNAFAEFLMNKNLKLGQFPEDAFLIDTTGKLIRGKYFVEWVEFRSTVIRDFTTRVREIVNHYNAQTKKNVQLAAYVGSWYESYWENGVNWASKNFRYNKRLNFPDTTVYSTNYYKTSYLENLDFLMIGTYYKNEADINKYITLGNILTNGEVPIYGSMSIPDLKNEQQAEVFKASLQYSDGLMIFDLCYITWSSFIENMKQAFTTK